MCYSAMVEQDAGKYALRFQAEKDLESYLKLFRARAEGQKVYINKAMEVPFVAAPTSPIEREIVELISQWHEKQAFDIENEISKQSQRLALAQQKLEIKATKTALNDERVASKKIKKLRSDLARHQSFNFQSESEKRIFPLHYMSMLCLSDDGRKVVRPFRYLMRPHDQSASFDQEFNGCYNARFDRLMSVPWWRDSLERRRGLIMVSQFYENVALQDYLKNSSDLRGEDSFLSESLVVSFQPKHFDVMLIPTLWDSWVSPQGEELFSAALITDEPAPEVQAAGHDRTPIFLKEDAVDGWLSAASGKAALECLIYRELPGYTHQIVTP